MNAPLNLAHIHPEGFAVTEFDVKGSRTLAAVLAERPQATLDLSQHAQVQFNAASNKVVVALHIITQVQEAGTLIYKAPSGRFELHFHFLVEKLSDLVIPATETAAPNLPSQLLLTLTGLAYSTARGLLWARLPGTALEGVTLPVIDPRQLFEFGPSDTAPAVQALTDSPLKARKPRARKS